MWALPMPAFLYAIGVAETVCGLGLLGFVAGLSSPLVSQWCALVPAITLAATTSHVAKGDPPDKVGFCATMTVLFVVVNFGIAAGRPKAKAG